MLCTACKYNCQWFKFLFVFFVSDFSRKHDTVGGNPKSTFALSILRALSTLNKEHFQPSRGSGLRLKRHLRNDLLRIGCEVSSPLDVFFSGTLKCRHRAILLTSKTLFSYKTFSTTIAEMSVAETVRRNVLDPSRCYVEPSHHQKLQTSKVWPKINRYFFHLKYFEILGCLGII